MMSFNSFPDKKIIANLSAKMLLEIGAINFRPNDPFILTSGKTSPVYIDCRKIISFPRVRSALMDFGASIILRDIGFESIDAVAGGETAGIPFAAWLSERLSLPMQYVRKKPKGFGRDAQIEGFITEGSKVLLVEDLTTDGQSKILFVTLFVKQVPRYRTLLLYSFMTFSPRRVRIWQKMALTSTTLSPGGMFWLSAKRLAL